MDSPTNTILKPIAYSPKILIAWKEAIGGNKKIREWLTNNGYKELGLFCFALQNDKKARGVLIASIIYLPLVQIALVLDKVFHEFF